MLWIPTRRRFCGRRTLVLLIAVMVVAIFLQHEWLVRTTLPPKSETILFMSDWTTTTTKQQIQAELHEPIRRPQQPRQKLKQQVFLSTRQSVTFQKKRATATASTLSTTRTNIVSQDKDDNNHWLPPRLHTCFLQPNQTVTFAIPRRHLIIAGAQKSGTSALYFILRQHPHMVSAKSVESHFFDWQYPSTRKNLNQWMQERHLPIIQTDYFHCAVRYEYFTQYFDGERLWESHLRNQSLITFEKTPSYLFLDKVPTYIHDILSPIQVDTKIVVSLRHPVERAYSQFHSDRMFGQVPWNATFEYFLNKELEKMRRFGLSKAPDVPTRAIGGGKSDGQYDDDKSIPLDEWDSSLFAIPKRVVTAFNNNNNKKNSKMWLDQAHWNVYRHTFQNNYLQRSMYAVQLRRWMKYFSLKESLLVFPYERFRDHPQQVVDNILLFCHVSMPDFYSKRANFNTTTNHGNASADQEFKSVYYHHGGQKEPLALSTRRYVERFLEPYNHDLARLLQGNKEDGWDKVWKQLSPAQVTGPVENHMLFPATNSNSGQRLVVDTGRIRNKPRKHQQQGV